MGKDNYCAFRKKSSCRTLRRKGQGHLWEREELLKHGVEISKGSAWVCNKCREKVRYERLDKENRPPRVNDADNGFIKHNKNIRCSVAH